MNKEEFKELTGEDPEDMFGPDWENEVGELELTVEDIKKYDPESAASVSPFCRLGRSFSTGYIL